MAQGNDTTKIYYIGDRTVWEYGVMKKSDTDLTRKKIQGDISFFRNWFVYTDILISQWCNWYVYMKQIVSVLMWNIVCVIQNVVISGLVTCFKIQMATPLKFKWMGDWSLFWSRGRCFITLGHVEGSNNVSQNSLHNTFLLCIWPNRQAVSQFP